MMDLIDRQATIDAIDEVTWYHQNKNGEMVAGAGAEHEAWYKADNVFEALDKVPTAAQWIPCSERRAEPNCLACDKFGQVFIARTIVSVNDDCYDGSDFEFGSVDEFFRGKKVGRGIRIIPTKIIAWMPLPEPYKGETING